MAKLIMPLQSQRASGRVGPMSFHVNQYGQAVGKHPVGLWPLTPATAAARAIFKTFVQAWKFLGPEDRESWTAQNDTGRPPYQEFLKRNFNAWRFGQDLITVCYFSGITAIATKPDFYVSTGSPGSLFWYNAPTSDEGVSFVVRWTSSPYNRSVIDPRKLTFLAAIPLDPPYLDLPMRDLDRTWLFRVEAIYTPTMQTIAHWDFMWHR